MGKAVNISHTPIPDLVVVEATPHIDNRGAFARLYCERELACIIGPRRIVQINHSRTAAIGAVRGLHYQLMQPQGKLVSVMRGAVFDVAVDVRRGSPHFGRWFGCVLDDVDHRQLYIPPGFAHGFCVLSEEADFFYKCTNFYHPASEHGIAWDDPEIGIAWPLRKEVTLSDKDRHNRPLAKQSPEDLPLYEQ